MMRFIAFISLLLLQVIQITSDGCLTPDDRHGTCISLYTCPKLIASLQKQPNGEEYVKKSRCGTTETDPLVCCPIETNNCTTPDGKPGKCVTLASCPAQLALLATQTPDSIAFVRKSACKITDTSVTVCCPDKTEKTATPEEKVDVFVPSRKYCGYQHSDDFSNTRETLGADITEFPWLAGIRYENAEGHEGKIKCLGAIINARYVLTGAHCLKKRSNVTLKSIRLGEYNIKNSTDCVEESGVEECSEPLQEFEPEEIVLHPQFQEGRIVKFDIGLIRLNGNIQFTDYVRPICLPLSDNTTPPPKIGDSIITTGWAKFSKTENEVKKKVLNIMISNDDCVQRYMVAGYPLQLSDDQWCTQELSENKEFTCLGDSGGPVMFSRKKQWYIEGINSFAASNCGYQYPVIHTKVARFMGWIRENMKPW